MESLEEQVYKQLRQNLIYTLSFDSNFAPFLADGTTW